MRVVRDHMAYKVARDRHLRPYEAQYFVHTVLVPREQSAFDDLAGLPRPLALIGFAGFCAWALTCLILLLVLLAIGIGALVAIVIAVLQTL
jgi:hypothetical protein